MERQNSITKNGNLNRLSASSATEQNQVPPSYAVNLPDGDRGYAPDSKSSYIQDGTNLKPISDRSSTDGVDLERGNSKVKRILNVLFPCARIYRSTKERYGPVTAVAAFVALLLVLLAAIGGIIFGIIVGVEKGLTGETFWSSGHGELFRICESDSTSGKPFQLHTCNVFRPGYDLNAAPIHAFTESVRRWSSGPGGKMSGQAQRVAPVQLESLLLEYGLKCSRPEGSPTPPVAALGQDSQIIIGGVGQFLKKDEHATACNYFEDGSLAAPNCAIYNDGGVKAPGKVWPKSINTIMTERFGMTCEWVA